MAAMRPCDQTSGAALTDGSIDDLDQLALLRLLAQLEVVLERLDELALRLAALADQAQEVRPPPTVLRLRRVELRRRPGSPSRSCTSSRNSGRRCP